MKSVHGVRKVRETSWWIMGNLSYELHVHINEAKIQEVADLVIDDINSKLKALPCGSEANIDCSFSKPVVPFDFSSSTVKDETALHSLTNADDETTMLFHFLIDGCNFCFWPTQGEFEYEDLVYGIKNQMVLGQINVRSLQQLDLQTFASWFAKQSSSTSSSSSLSSSYLESESIISALNLEERLRLVHELACNLDVHFDGKVSNLVRRANKSASNLVDLIVALFPGFRDETVYNGRQVFFYKRAQIFVGDIWGAFKGQGYGEFDDISELTMFADYRVPQLLRHLGALEYDQSLAAMVDARQEIPASSALEIQIRAASIIAVEKIRDSIQQRHGRLVSSIDVDWCLWEYGEKLDERGRGNIHPHHRTRTVFY